jgi:hypothetical protein
MLKVLLPTVVFFSALPSARAQYREADAWETVRELYKRFLHRDPDPTAAGWVAALREGQGVNHVVAGILTSAEYYKNAGNNPPSFIRELFSQLADRQPSPEEMRYFLHEFRLGAHARVVQQMLARYPQDEYYGQPSWRDRYDYRRPNYRYR